MATLKVFQVERQKFDSDTDIFGLNRIFFLAKALVIAYVNAISPPRIKSVGGE